MSASGRPPDGLVEGLGELEAVRRVLLATAWKWQRGDVIRTPEDLAAALDQHLGSSSARRSENVEIGAVRPRRT